MPRVRFINVDLEVDVAAGATLLEAARDAGAPVGSHCGGVCACSTCHLYVHDDEAVSAMKDDERDMLELGAKQRRATSRLGCQTIVSTDVRVDVSEESFRTFLDDHPDQRPDAMARWKSD